jgi:hypothetical protein
LADDVAALIEAETIDAADKKHILAAGERALEAGGEAERPRDFLIGEDGAAVSGFRSTDETEEGRFAGTVGA